MTIAKSAGNVTVTYNSNALTAYLNAASFAGIVNQIDTTNMASAANASIPGLDAWSAEIGGFHDATIDGYLSADASVPPTTLRTLIVVVNGVTYTWTTSAYVSNWSVNATSPSEAVTWSCTLTCSGSPVIS